MKKINDSLEEYVWSDIRDKIQQLNPAFADAVDALEPGDECKIYKATYPYGELILDEGKFQLPIGDDEYAFVHSEKVPKDVRERLGYSPSVPMGMAVNKKLELFIDNIDRTAIYAIASPGNIFALTAVLDPSLSCDKGRFWNMTAGARTAFMLPKISDAPSHRRIKQYCYVAFEKPRILLDHWNIFTGIAGSGLFDKPWRAEVLFFSKEWVVKRNDIRWKAFRGYLLELAWQHASLWRNHTLFNQMFIAEAKAAIRLRPNPNINHLMNHLIAIAANDRPGFVVSTDDSFLPLRDLQRAYVRIYQLKHYMPIIMEPSYLSGLPAGRKSVYCSLQLPNLINQNLEYRLSVTAKFELNEVKSSLESLQKEILKNKLAIDRAGPSLVNIMEKTHFDYFHPKDEDPASGVRSIKELADTDQNYQEAKSSFRENKIFPESSKFMCGCVRITQDE